MSTAVVCSSGRTLAVTEKHAGKTLKCPGCGGPVAVPAAGGEGARLGMAPAAAEGLTPFERAVVARLDRVAHLLGVVAWRAGAVAVCAAVTAAAALWVAFWTVVR
jgi:hypothetical protein